MGGRRLLSVNGKRQRRAVENLRTLLIHFLREQLILTGAHIGCDTSHCGACTVELDRHVGEDLHGVRRTG